jgi:hypothetical protein
MLNLLMEVGKTTLLDEDPVFIEARKLVAPVEPGGLVQMLQAVARLRGAGSLAEGGQERHDIGGDGGGIESDSEAGGLEDASGRRSGGFDLAS